ncbi:hypothetical protein EJB05_28892 [Eragrostis curvula]|uniref:ATP phosphoribosyltransferase n=1 Tax=Eragrostis curvula TaxID=38414 RepID=A0A5J9UR59_9POAL|nr:hypothetical protein EJB05_28892 [Eragrostis curvula]
MSASRQDYRSRQDYCSSSSELYNGIKIPNIQVWFQRPKDIVRKLQSGYLDLFSEYGIGNDDLVVVHEALAFGHFRLSLAVPKEDIFKKHKFAGGVAKHVGGKFLKENDFKHVKFLSADGALESYPPMGMADAIMDLVSSGTTLRENNLKEIHGGVVLESQATLVASRRSLHTREGVLEVTRELLERLPHSEFGADVNIRATSALQAVQSVSQTSICGLKGPNISSVYRTDGKVDVEYYAVDIGGSGVLVTKLTYTFEEETPRWHNLLTELGL